MSILYKNGKIYVSEKKSFLSGAVAVDNGIITRVYFDGDAVDENFEEIFDLEGARVVPGLVDVHTHGRVGGDFCLADAQSLSKMSDSYKEKGSTSVMATLATVTLNELYGAIERISAESMSEESVFIGIHLEGRFLNEKRKGAHNASLLAPLEVNEIGGLVNAMKRAGYAHVSAALELDESGDFTAEAIRCGATLGLAHTNATYEESAKAFERGAVSLTHTYNAMSPLHHRDVGAVGAGLLTEGVYCELICDGFHVSPEAVRLAYILKKDKIVLITDSVAGTCMPDGESSIGGLSVFIKDGKVRLADGTIAGSTLTLADGVKNLAEFAKIPYEDAIYCATASPAKMIGAYDSIGSIDEGKMANMIILDEDNNVSEVIFRGVKI